MDDTDLLARVLEIRIGVVEILRGFVVERSAPLDDGAREQLATEHLGQRADLVDGVLGGDLVAVDLDGAEVVEVALAVFVNANAQPHPAVVGEPGAAELADVFIKRRGIDLRGLDRKNRQRRKQRDTPQGDARKLVALGRHWFRTLSAASTNNK